MVAFLLFVLLISHGDRPTYLFVGQNVMDERLGSRQPELTWHGDCL